MMELSGICREYVVGAETVHALDHVDLTIGAGEYVSIMGPSGSGKSTLLNVLGLLDRPTSGTYRLQGEDVSQLDDDALAAHRQRHIGFIFQFFHLIPRLTALENVELPLVLTGAAPRARRERAAAILESVGLKARLDHRPDQLSGGERQRVAIGRALIMQPSYLLADEPTGNLDTRSGNEIMQILEQLNRDGIARLDRDSRSRDRRPRPPPPEAARRQDRRRRARAAAVKARDVTRMSLQALRRYPLRTAMMLLAIAIGVAAVVLLTAVGEGARRYVTGQFSSLGTELLIVLPGRAETAGGGSFKGCSSARRRAS